jgi:hypothetical protein
MESNAPDNDYPKIESERGAVEMAQIYQDPEKLKLQTNNNETLNKSKDQIKQEEDVKINIRNSDPGDKVQYSLVPQEAQNSANRVEPDSSEKKLEDEELLGKMILDVDKAFLVDEKAFSGAANDDIEDPEVYQKLVEEVQLQHPQRKMKDGGHVPYQVCNTHTGNMGCSEAQSKSDLEPLGLGMVIYFKILKAFTVVFFCIILLNIPLYYIYSINHPEYEGSSYKDMLFKTTIGNIGSSKFLYKFYLK